MKTLEEAESDILALINDKQELTYDEIKKYCEEAEIDADMLDRSLEELEKAKVIAKRSSGGIPTYYMLLQEHQIKRVFIVEDDENINNLMALSIKGGGDLDITQIYDGAEALERIRNEKPDLVILDLMLPHLDGLQICQAVKSDPKLSDTTIIIVSALDATSNRFKGIKYGADYYIKKPFDPNELRTLVTIFLKKKGKKFDPLIDLPNEERISAAIEDAAKAETGSYVFARLRVAGLAEFTDRFGSEAGITILRLVSQLLQDKVKDDGKVFAGFLNGDDFVVAGNESDVGKVVEGLKSEFSAVLPFIYQDEGYKPIEKGVENDYANPNPPLSLEFSIVGRKEMMERRAEVLKSKGTIGSYTYDELRHILGGEDIDITITRDPNGVRLSVSKSAKAKKEKKERDDIEAI